MVSAPFPVKGLTERIYIFFLAWRFTLLLHKLQLVPKMHKLKLVLQPGLGRRISLATPRFA